MPATRSMSSSSRSGDLMRRSSVPTNIPTEPSFSSTTPFMPAMNHGHAPDEHEPPRPPVTTHEQTKTKNVLSKSKRIFHRVKEMARGSYAPNKSLTPAFDIVAPESSGTRKDSQGSWSSPLSTRCRDRADSGSSGSMGYMHTAATSVYDFEYPESKNSPSRDASHQYGDGAGSSLDGQHLQVPPRSPKKRPHSRMDPEEASEEEAAERAKKLAEPREDGTVPGNPLARKRQDRRDKRVLRLPEVKNRRQWDSYD